MEEFLRPGRVCRVMDSTAVEQDRSANAGYLVYFAVLVLIGGGLITAGVMWDWGFWAYFGGGVVLFAGFASTAGMMMTGGIGRVKCPQCGTEHEVQHITMHRYLECTGCHAWLEGAEMMHLVPEDRVADHPAFLTELPETVRWVEDGHGLICPTCGGHADSVVTAEGRSALGSAAAVMSPVSVQRVIRLDVPVCKEHRDGVALFKDGTPQIGFRSYAYMRRFRALNDAERAAS